MRVVAQSESWETYPCLFYVALFQDLGHNFHRILCAKLILEDGVGGAVECTLSSVSSQDVSGDGLDGGRERQSYLCVTKTSKLFTTSISGVLLSFFHRLTASAPSIKTRKSSSLPL